MSFRELFEYLAQQPLLALAVAAIFVTTMGGLLRRSMPALGRFLRGAGHLGLVGALLLTIVQVARFTTGSELAMPQLGLPDQKIEGLETRIPMSGNGHFWLQANVNGEPRHFMIDTGATLTAISEDTAIAAGVPKKSIRQVLNMRTANGPIRAELVTIDELRFGNIVARDLDAVIAPGLEDANVIGMNLLSRLASWRVEDNTLILVPRPAQRTMQKN